MVISCLDSRFVEDHPGSKVVWSKNEEPVEMDGEYMFYKMPYLVMIVPRRGFPSKNPSENISSKCVWTENGFIPIHVT